MRKILLPAIFLLAAPPLLAFSLIYLTYFSYLKQTNGHPSFAYTKTPAVSFAALPSTLTITEQEITQQDARIEIVRQFFEKHNSPLEPYAKDVVSYADEYNLDFRLVPAIAMQESNLCKKAPSNSHNCWGFGVYGKQVTRFASYKEGIYHVTKTLSTHYKDSGLETPEEIMSKYTPSNTGSWAASVNFFMNQLQ